MKKIRHTFFCLTCFIVLISCKKESNLTDNNNNNTNLPTKSVVLKAIETDTGVFLSWNKVNFTVDNVLSFDLMRGKNATFNLILSPWAGDYMWTRNTDSTYLDKAPAFSDKAYYKIVYTLKSGEKVISNVVDMEFKNSIFIKNYRTVQSFHDTLNNTYFLSDALKSKILSVNYLTKETVESSVETEMFNGGALLKIVNGSSEELYALTKVYGKLNIFDSKTLQLKKTIDARSTNLIYNKGLVYFSSYPNISVMNTSDNSIIQTVNYYPWYGEMNLILVPNSNKLLGVSQSVANKVRAFTLNVDGTIQSHGDLPEPNSGGNEIYGQIMDIHPTNNMFISGFKGNIYNVSNLSYQTSLNLNFNPGVEPKYAFSPDGKYLAVTTTNIESPIIIYNIPSLTKKYSFEVPDCIVQNISWKSNNRIVAVATTKYNDYINGTVILNRKVVD